MRHAATSPRTFVPLLLARLGMCSALCLGVSCGEEPEAEGRAPEEELESALSPTTMARALQRSGGGLYRATTTLEITPPAETGSPGQNAEGVTTTTSVWMDRIGHYRLVENNDRDGGREVILHSRQLGVALRYGKLIRRTAHEPEPTRLLEEALGGPWTAWEIARRFAEVKRQEDPKTNPATLVYQLGKASVPRAVRGGFESASPLRKWRETIALQSLRGEVRLEKATGLLTSVRMEARFSLRRDGVPLSGVVRVEASVRDRGRVQPISPPPAEELPVRQRTILEERQLLGRPANEGAGRGRVGP